MKAFVTGGTGFIGRRLVRLMIDHGYHVNALVRSQEGASRMRFAGASPFWGNINALGSLSDGMRGCDIVIHLAGWYRLGTRSWRLAENVNVGGTRNVLGLAYHLGVPKIIHISSVAVFGDTRGELPDENYHRGESPFATIYERTKWQAHYQVAVPLIDQGAPIIIVIPGVAYGPGDPSLVGDLMVNYYRGLFPLLPGPELKLAYGHVEDIAQGIFLASEKGRIGESYILAGEPLSLLEASRLWSEICGRRPPLITIPARILQPFAESVGRASEFLRLPALISRDAIKLLPVCYIASSAKAHAELGWQSRPVERGFRETFEWIAQNNQPIDLARWLKNRQVVVGLLLFIASILMVSWFKSRRQKAAPRT